MAHAPGILPEYAQRFVGKRVGGIADALDEVRRDAEPVCLHGGEARNREVGREGVSQRTVDRGGEGLGGRERADIEHAAVVHRKRGLEREIVEIRAELGVVPSDAPGKVVAELVALLGALDGRVGLTAEIGEAGDIYRRVGAGRYLGVVEIIQAAAGVLEAELIHLAVAEGPSVLHNARRVTVALSRSARIGVLTEGLVLSAAFDAGDRAWAGIEAQREAVIVVYVMVDAKRVEAGAFEDREVPFLCHLKQRLV